MRLAVFADGEVRAELHRLSERADFPLSAIFYHSYDDFLAGLPASGCHGVLVAQPGAVGMESVRAARILLPSVSILWLSNDPGFAIESYRLGCCFFTAEGIPSDLLDQIQTLVPERRNT